jgi:hypothetical protein
VEIHYVWSVTSAIKWAFADLETLSAEADRQTMSAEDQKRLAELLRNRHVVAFCAPHGSAKGQKECKVGGKVTHIPGLIFSLTYCK